MPKHYKGGCQCGTVSLQKLNTGIESLLQNVGRCSMIRPGHQMGQCDQQIHLIIQKS